MSATKSPFVAVIDFMHCERCQFDWPAGTRRCDGCGQSFYRPEPVASSAPHNLARLRASGVPMSPQQRAELALRLQEVLLRFGCDLKHLEIDGEWTQNPILTTKHVETSNKLSNTPFKLDLGPINYLQRYMSQLYPFVKADTLPPGQGGGGSKP